MPLTASAGTPLKERAVQLWNRFIGPKEYLDSAYVFQPRRNWDVSVSYKGHWNGIGFGIPLHYEPEDGDPKDVTMNMVLADHTAHNIGLYVGFGPLNVGYSYSLGKTPGQGDSKLSLDWLCPFYGVQFYYSSFGQRSANISFEGMGADTDLDYPSTINILRAEGYYAFNKNHFSYHAAYKGRMIQRKSAGSVVLSAKYQHTDVLLQRGNQFLDSFLLNTGSYAIDQFCLGVGYSFNWVLYHRDVQGAGYKGLRNLTVNLTGVPQLTFINELLMTQYSGDQPSGDLRVHGRMNPNLMGKFGICYTVGPVYIVARFEYHLNKIQSGVMPAPDKNYSISVNGNLSNWFGGFDIHYRF